jgi:hypothetical protein
MSKEMSLEKGMLFVRKKVKATGMNIYKRPLGVIDWRLAVYECWALS